MVASQPGPVAPPGVGFLVGGHQAANMVVHHHYHYHILQIPHWHHLTDKEFGVFSGLGKLETKETLEIPLTTKTH